MAIPTAELETLRDNLIRAMASGILTVRHGDKWLTYQDADDMQSALEFIDGQLATEGAVTEGRHRQVLVRTTRGLC